MAKHNVFTNSRSNIHKGSGDKASAAAPDVCKTPIGPSIVPIPYPNISKSADLAKGTKSVKINNQSAALKKSNFSTSTGDDAGVAKGIISGKHKDKTEFVSYSFDVKFEGQNAVRHADMTTHNSKNTIGGVFGSSTTPQPIESEKCPYCKKDEHKLADKWGNHIGDGQTLRKDIIANIEDHVWYTGSNSLQAHHLICSEAMDDDDWSKYCKDFGYDINHKKNGVMLPFNMDLACQLHVAMHRSNHSAGRAQGISYPEKIKNDLERIANDVRSGKYCDNPKALIDKLNRYSERTLGKISRFRWTITADGQDYKLGNNGCAGVTSITNKPHQSCPHGRSHGIPRKDETSAIPQMTEPLKIGT